jgi:fermentation-respiration switch protein FrsA (DUF1100 family)
MERPEEDDGTIDMKVNQLLSPWLKFFLAYDPAEALREVTCPVLALIGEKDVQVPPDQNIPPLESVLAGGAATDFAVIELPGLNHLFQTSETGAVSEYGKIEETIAPEALKVMSDWIIEHTR